MIKIAVASENEMVAEVLLRWLQKHICKAQAEPSAMSISIIMSVKTEHYTH